MNADLVITDVKLLYEINETDLYGQATSYEPAYTVTFAVKLGTNTAQLSFDVKTEQGYTAAVAEAAKLLEAAAHDLCQLAKATIDSPQPSTRQTAPPKRPT